MHKKYQITIADTIPFLTLVHIYRNTAAAWNGDEKALVICLEGLESGKYEQLSPIMRAEYPNVQVVMRECLYLLY